MIDFKINREYLKQGYTIGKLYYKINDGEWLYFCDTLEDVVRHTRKVYGETAIPFGTYKFIVVYSPTFGQELPLLLDVPNFTGIMIHAGNSKLDTSGCILLGENKVKGQVVNSRATVAMFMSLLRSNVQKEYLIKIE